MSNTVVGIFEYTSEAQEAKKYLLDHGFSEAHVDIKISTTGNTAVESVKDEDAGDRISNFFKGLFGDDEDEVNRYSEAGRRGTIVTVHAKTADEAETAARILDNYGAVDVNETSGSYGAADNTYGARTPVTDTTFSATPTTDIDSTNNTLLASDADITDNTYPTSDTHISRNPYTSDADISGSTFATSDADISDNVYATDDTDITNATSIPVIQEELFVGKKEVTTGGVRLRSRIIERPVEESIRLREEYVTIERTPVDRPATESDFNTFKEETVEVIEHAEVPVVSKEARVVEEVSLEKQVEERDEVIHETLRSTEVETENIPGTETTRRTDLNI
jgi:uncharacterized protein (TIGR02271 family)